MSETQRKGAIKQITQFLGPDHGWIAGQLLLFSATAILPPAERSLSGTRMLPVPTWLHLPLAAGSGIAAALIGRKAQIDLAENLRMSPTPKEEGSLVTTGIYGKVRHPMYSAVLLALLGWTLAWNAWTGAGILGVGAIFFSRKTDYEERKLHQIFPDYSVYKKNVPDRFVPRIW